MGGRIALVTGGSRGIGAAVAHNLAREGHRVAVTFATDRSGADEVVADLEATGSSALAVQADVRSPEAIDAAFALVEETWGPIEVVVANAGVTADGLLVRMGDEQWSDVVRTSLDGAFFTIRRAVPGMMRSRWGRVVAVSSVAGSAGSAGQANYAAAKAGLVGLTRSVARELASRNVTANVVEPGPVATAMTDRLPEARREELARQVPLGRFGTSEEVAAAVSFLCSDAAAFVTGAVLPVDGGLGMGR
ncbi:MAG: 3-oxoacyl-[acyl-carrier-protein] reductase [Acidimicrobiales bacterium]|nr:3-oxoacyl-[acyl-carrier-protein] reductase [Acidimicrobiales bacterium]